MKFYTSQIQQILSKVTSGTINGILMYGPDKGYISSISENLTKNQEFFRTSFTASEINSEKLEMLLNTQNLFAQKTLIKITGVTNSFDKKIVSLLKEYSGNNIVTLIADELAASSEIRKLFETATNFASIGCYHDDEQSVLKIITQKLSGKKATKEAVSYLQRYLKGDHKLICNELDKLLLFTQNNTDITLNDVAQIISKDLEGSGDDLCVYFANKEIDKFVIELERLISYGINEILIIRALIRYYINLYIVLSKIEDGDNIDNAIKSITPPIFFKYLPSFRKSANSIKKDKVLETLFTLQKAEAAFKTGDKMVLSELLMNSLQ